MALIAPQVKTTDAVGVRSMLYTSGVDLGSSRFLGYFLRYFSHIFDGEPVSFDHTKVPSDDQIQILVQDAAGLCQLCAFANRVELRQLRSTASPINIEAHMTLAEKLFNGYRAYLPLGTAHVGCNIVWVSRDDQPARTISRYFCQERWVDGPLDGVDAFEFSTRQQFLLDGQLKVNSSIYCGSHTTVGDAQLPVSITHPGIVFDQSLKTYGSELDPAQIVNFFRLAPEELTRSLRNFFPPVERAVS